MDPLTESRVLGFGNLHVLTDDLVVFILGQLPLIDLVNLSSTSGAFYVICNEDDLWKRHCLKRFPNSSFEFKGTWKQTLIESFPKGKNQNSVPNGTAPSNLKIAGKGFRSDYLYARWWRSNVDLRQYAHETGDIERVDASKLSLVDFIHKYDEPGKPVLIKGIVDKWPAMKNWSVENLEKKYKDIEWKISHKEKGRPRLNMDHYVTYCKRQHDENPLYAFDSVYGDKAPDMLQDYTVPEYFKEDFLELLGDVRPEYRWFIMGPMRSGTPWHTDPHGTSAWNALISGRKRWALYPPDIIPPGVIFRTSWEGEVKFESVFPVEWYFSVYPLLAPEDRPIEIVQEPGEMIYVPRGWWHTVMNIEDTVAVTQNFINRQNLLFACEELLRDLRVDDFELLKRKVLEQHPDLEGIFTGVEERMHEAISRARERHKDFDYFGAVTQLCGTHGFPVPVKKDLITAADSSTNLVYFYNKMVFKFYRDPKDGEESFKKELEIYGILGNTSISHMCPSLKAHGRLNESETDKWKWPYIVTTQLSGECYGEVDRDISKENQLDFASRMGKIVKQLHGIPIEGNKVFADDFVNFLQYRRKHIIVIHKKWGSVSFDLINQLNGYLPSESEISQLVTRKVLIHADLTDDNILGMYEDGMISGEKKKQKKSSSSNGKHDDSTLWTPTGLIDFGDSRYGDCMYELIALFFAVFKCDKKLMKAFLVSYGEKDWPQGEQFTKIAMCFTILHACDAMRTVYQYKPALYAARDWKTIEKELWDLNSA